MTPTIEIISAASGRTEYDLGYLGVGNHKTQIGPLTISVIQVDRRKGYLVKGPYLKRSYMDTPDSDERKCALSNDGISVNRIKHNQTMIVTETERDRQE